MSDIYQTKRHKFFHKSGALAWDEIIPAPEQGKSIVICDVVAAGMTLLELKDSDQNAVLGSDERLFGIVAGAEQGISLMGLNIVAKNGGAIQGKTSGAGDQFITITYYIA